MVQCNIDTVGGKTTADIGNQAAIRQGGLIDVVP